ncbi:hypothetical protein ACFC1T_08445 [Kitasatospora sp. NPDC056076]|uniref:hypothetical protein n=1 Tax=Kitasatospora sp. NPDC056076 TaxID=3345703 RepID=UPI0035DAAAE4
MTQTPTNAQTAAPENVTLSFKGGAGYDASLLVLRAGSLTEMDTLLRTESAALKSLLEQAAKVQSYNTGLNSPAGAGSAARAKFENGKVVSKGTPSGPGDDDCPHGRKLVDKGNWSAMFCQAPQKPDQCAPLWKQPDGSFKAK